MKKYFVAIILVLSMLISVMPAIGADTEVGVYVNGKSIISDQPGVLAFGRTLVPLRAICEAMDCQVEWFADEQIIEIRNEYTIISLKINNDILKKLDKENEEHQEEIQLDVAPVIYNGRTLVPARAVAEALYAKVEWNAAEKCVYITREFDFISTFDEDGLAIAKKGDKYGYINRNRDAVIELKYDKALYFSEGFAAVAKGEKYGFINKEGKEITSFVYEDTTPFDDGFAIVKKKGKWGYINDKGKEITTFIYDEAYPFCEGLAAVVKDKKVGYINTNGIRIVSFMYDSGSDFFGGFAAVTKNGKWGYVNNKGSLVVGCKYDCAYTFCEGLAAVQKDGKWGYVDAKGKEVIPCEYDDAHNFSGGLALVAKNGEEFYIDKNGYRAE